jgi:hypothetical protein
VFLLCLKGKYYEHGKTKTPCNLALGREGVWIETQNEKPQPESAMYPQKHGHFFT